MIDSARAKLSSSGTGTFNFSNANNGVPYYIQLKHRSSIGTWSATLQSFTNSTLSYDFSNLNTKAYGNNIIQVDASPVKFAIYGGDVNQDGSVNLSDITSVYYDANSFVTGYKVTK